MIEPEIEFLGVGRGPVADDSRTVPRLVQDLRQRWDVQPRLFGRHEGIAHPMPVRPGAGEHGDQAWGRPRTRNIAIRELRAALGKPREIGRELTTVTGSEQSIGAQRVGANEHDVGRGVRPPADGGRFRIGLPRSPTDHHNVHRRDRREGSQPDPCICARQHRRPRHEPECSQGYRGPVERPQATWRKQMPQRVEMGHRIQRRGRDHAGREQQGSGELARDQQENGDDSQHDGGARVIRGIGQNQTDDVPENTDKRESRRNQEREQDKPAERVRKVEAVVGQDFLGHLRSRAREIEDRLEYQHDGRDPADQERHFRAVRERRQNEGVERPHGHTGLLSRKSRKRPRHSRPRPAGESTSARNVSA